MKKSGFRKPGGFKKKTGFSNKQTKLNDDGSKKERNKRRSRNRKNKRKDPLWNQVVRCDRVFSRLVRIIGASDNGVCRCFTCGKMGYWKRGGIECGHYKSRSNLRTRWHLDNARPQCTHCNQVLGGNREIFRTRLIEERGETIVLEVESKSREVVKLNREDVRAIRLKFEKMEREVRKKKGL